MTSYRARERENAQQERRKTLQLARIRKKRKGEIEFALEDERQMGKDADSGVTHWKKHRDVRWEATGESGRYQHTGGKESEAPLRTCREVLSRMKRSGKECRPLCSGSTNSWSQSGGLLTLDAYEPRLGTGGGKVKADEWRNAMLVYPVALFEAWRVGDTIPDGDAPLPKAGSEVKAKEDHTAELMGKRRKKHAARQSNASAVDYAAIEATGASRNYNDHYLNPDDGYSKNLPK
ncbi:hypothetical protein B0H13DRAFT_1915915 [Mycena leptocephala]|nr:hypothetical protein B0H13DRAFT_1915915 [Mycena leptocephala]